MTPWMLDPWRADLGSLLQIAIAMLLGAAIGLERELGHKSAGLRTHMLVSGASALFVILGMGAVQTLGSTFGADLIRADPLRIIQAVATGISFLGAGAILRHKDNVQGLTTAASILLVAGLGMCAALSRYVLACGLTVLALLTLRGLHAVENWLQRRREKR